MKYLKKFNESMEEQIYNQVLDTIKDCFQEFEDNGWYWSKGLSSTFIDGHISHHPMPHFKYIMKEKEKSDYISYDPYDYKKFEFTGEKIRNYIRLFRFYKRSFKI